MNDVWLPDSCWHCMQHGIFLICPDQSSLLMYHIINANCVLCYKEVFVGGARLWAGLCYGLALRDAYVIYVTFLKRLNVQKLIWLSTWLRSLGLRRTSELDCSVMNSCTACTVHWATSRL